MTALKVSWPSVFKSMKKYSDFPGSVSNTPLYELISAHQREDRRRLLLGGRVYKGRLRIHSLQNVVHRVDVERFQGSRLGQAGFVMANLWSQHSNPTEQDSSYGHKVFR